MEDPVLQNYEDINYDIIIDDDDSLASAIDPLENKILEIEGVYNENKGRKIEEVDAENKGVESKR